jgi:Predicted membrane protein (DUF2142)
VTVSEQLRTEDSRSPSPPPSRGARRGPRIVLAIAALVALAGTVLVAVLAYQTLSEKQPRRSGTNSVFPSAPVANLERGQTLCQAVTVPRGTGAIEIPFEGAARAAAVRLTVRDQTTNQVVARADAGPVRARWTRFTLPQALPRDVLGQVCLRQGRGERHAVMGSIDKRGLELDGQIVNGGITIAYYRPGEERLVSMLPEIARRIGRTRGQLGGAWRGSAIVVLFGVAVGLSGWLLFGLARGRVRPRQVAVVAAVVAVANAFAWSMLTPTFQVPDETYHTSYVQDLAEHGKPPRAAEDGLSQEMYAIIQGAAAGDINFNPFGRGRWSPDAEAEFDRGLAEKPSTDNKRASQNVRDYPPAYYASLVPAYAATHAAGGSTLDAMTFMRGIGALFAAITVLALFAMLRELFPDRLLLCGGVALICAFQPVFTWISGGINPDAALIPAGAVLFWLVVRAQRHGLTVPLATAIGGVAALAGLIKLAGLGLVPGAALGVVLLLWKHAPEGRLRPALAAAGAFAIPPLIYVGLLGLVWNLPIVPGAVSGIASAPTGGGGSDASSFATYLWQYALPPVGGMTDFFKVAWTPKDFWTPLFVGRFGWFDYGFPPKVNNFAFVVYAVIAVAALVALVPRIRRDWIIVIVFAAFTAGLLVAIARVAYPLRAGGHVLFEQARYVLPLIGLYASALGLAFSLLRGRALVAVTSVAVALSSVHLLAAFVLTVRRYYL